ncbi:hypothetical protein [Caulobacter hibisci]|uniref:Phage gp6-like head-tail connector protein n=1 Tax=Caulobacter hibisci TaxID=2035993 RepID=A0ABS0SXU2_9CAUL|nr:hypothetical protein [Caulobacter hibisci]MBI1684460.1 hypothetical protein [Caulobacter hibisci]
MASRESIVNKALRHLGEEPTETLDLTVARTAVRKVLGFLDAARDAVLIAHDWLDARAYLTLQPSAMAGNWRWPSCYLLAPEMLMVRDVVGCGAWERGTEVDAGTGAELIVVRTMGGGAIRVVATRRIGWSVVPVYLEEAMGLMLAAMACMSVNGDEARASGLDKRAASAIGAAQGKDGIQAVAAEPVFSDPYGVLRRSAG